MGRTYNRSRREFIKQVAVLAQTSAVATAMPWWKPVAAGLPVKAPSDRVRLGIIGPGSRGHYLMLNLQQIEGIEIVAICDDYPPHYDRALSLAGTGAQGFRDYRDLLAMQDLDGVVIATPLHEHARMTIDTLHAGLPVFVEKSLARTVEECFAITRAAEETGQIFQIGHQRLYSLRFLKALEMIKAGAIGPLRQFRAYWHRNGDWRRSVPSPELERKINWRMYHEYSCGLMTELASHHIQVANWFLGEKPEMAVGSGGINHWKDGREVYDNVHVTYRYPSGVHLLYDSMISNRKYGLEVQIMGPEGTIEAETGKLFREDPPPAPGIVQLINDIERGIFDSIPIGGASWVPDLEVDSKGTYITDEPPTSDGSDVQLVAFANAIREGRPIEGMIDQALHAGVATLMGFNAMVNEEIVYWPTEFEA
jgi:predicted dehydrogenase